MRQHDHIGGILRERERQRERKRGKNRGEGSACVYVEGHVRLAAYLRQ